MVLFDFQTGKWSDLIQTTIDFPNWSQRWVSTFISYTMRRTPPSLRIRISDRKVGQVANLRGFLATGFWRFWLGLDPGDAPIMLRDSGTEDVYSLDWITAK